MNQRLFLLIIIPVFALIACKSEPDLSSKEETRLAETSKERDTSGSDKASYALGALIAMDLKENKSIVEYEQLFKGLKDVFENNTIAYSDEEMVSALSNQVDPEISLQSYARGYAMANNFKNQNLGTISTSKFIVGINDVRNGKTLSQSAEELKEIVTTFQQNSMQKMQLEEKKRGLRFLAENAKKEGVQTTPSGLQYKVIQKGTGKEPSTVENVLVHYTGKLINGKVFDSSIERGEPARFAINAVIPGWTEGVLLMHEGAKYQFFIPYDLAYGEVGSGQIPPYATLIFDVELLKVISKPKSATPPPSFQKK